MSISTQEKSYLTSETVDALSAANNEPAWAKDQRVAAWQAFERLPIPAKEDEAWRRTDISRLNLPRYQPSRAALEPALEPSPHFQSTDESAAGAVLLEDGRVFHGLAPSLKSQGLVFSDLATALKEHPVLVRKYLGQAVTASQGKFEALNAALWNRGIFLYVPRNVQVSVPLSGGYAFSPTDGSAVFPRTVVVLEEGARATYFDEYASPSLESGQALSCAAVEIFLAPGAELQYFNVQRWGRGVHHFLTQHGRLDRDARLTTLAIALGGKLSKVNLGSDLVGAGAESRLYGLVFGDGGQHFTHHTLQSHQVSHTTSDLLFKAALKDKARSVFTGMIHITKEAQKTAAYQSSRNLLLSDGAKADTIPMLEILADDVQCGHGASVGSLDEDQRFYLMTRGLSPAEAERAIVDGFFEEVLQRIPLEGTREKLKAAIDHKLGAGG
jgi:Fe-S cluster assembly protein SufD